MSYEQDTLESMAWQDYHALEERMCAWTLAAEAELQSAEKPRQIILDLLFWVIGEFHRRRRYMGQTEPKTERHAGEVLRELAMKMQEAKKEREL